MIPVDIKSSYPKGEEKGSLFTKDPDEALRLIKIKAVQIDERFEDHRRIQELLHTPENLDVLDYDELSDETIAPLEKEHLAALLKKDAMERRRGFEQKSDYAPLTIC